jgi:hypothetical protein
MRKGLSFVVKAKWPSKRPIMSKLLASRTSNCIEVDKSGAGRIKRFSKDAFADLWWLEECGLVETLPKRT